jgi:hypothetical protein
MLCVRLNVLLLLRANRCNVHCKKGQFGAQRSCMLPHACIFRASTMVPDDDRTVPLQVYKKESALTYASLWQQTAGTRAYKHVTTQV